MWQGWPAPTMVEPGDALTGRDTPMRVGAAHAVLGVPTVPPFPMGTESIVLGMGCFWGAERSFWELPGVVATAVGYAGGFTPNPTHDEVGTGRTGHVEAVLVVFDPRRVSRAAVLRCFWENHDPTQGYRQGSDVGTQYRSAIYTTSVEQMADAVVARARYDAVLRAEHFDPITTEVGSAGPFFYAEDRHQQYLAKDPTGYCGNGGTGVGCSWGIDIDVADA